VPSSPRIIALGRYLTALAQAEDAWCRKDESGKEAASATCRKGLHALYLLNDLLHHSRYHTPNSSLFSTLTASIQPFLVELVRYALCGNRPKIRMRIDSLLQLWEEEAYLGKAFVDKLRGTVIKSATLATDNVSRDQAASTGQSSFAKDQSYMMPATHGDPSTPYHDLPAGNLMPHIMPNKSVPIRPDDVRALQFVAGPADDTLVVALKDFMVAVEKIDDNSIQVRDDEGIIEDVDELGQSLLRDEAGELVAGRTYYGWSREFCEKMKGRSGRKARLGRERSYNSSSSRSRSPRKRRRYSTSASRTSSSYSRSRSRSPYNGFRNGRRENTWGGKAHDENRSSLQSRSYSSTFRPPGAQSDPRASVDHAPFYQTAAQIPRPPAHPLPEGIPPPPSIPPSNMDFAQNAFPPLPLGPGNLPIPPPRPANYSGPWPPPPPPLPPTMAFNVDPGVQPYHASPSFTRSAPYQGGQRYRRGAERNQNQNQWPQ
jgi:CID domain